MIRVRVIVGGTLITVVAALAASAVAAPYGGTGSLTLAGRVGPLHFDRSAEADVVAFAGQPAATNTSNFDAIPRDPNTFEMGYGCQEHSQGWLQFVDQFDYCRTVFYLNDHTHRLAAFYSTSARYSFRGARPGITTKSAEGHIHAPARVGCLSGFNLGSGRGHAWFYGAVQGGHTGKQFMIIGGHLRALELESNRYPVGLLFC